MTAIDTMWWWECDALFNKHKKSFGSLEKLWFFEYNKLNGRLLLFTFKPMQHLFKEIWNDVCPFIF
jgi:hypothetical protein